MKNEQPVLDLKGARSTLVTMRRNWATALSQDYVKGKSEDGVTKFLEIQAAIEAIDRAIKDEGMMSFDRPATPPPTPGRGYE